MFFEQVVVRLLVNIAYGGAIEIVGRAVRRSGDGEIDGIRRQDRLGLDNVYGQAKCHAADMQVRAVEVGILAGALQMQKATKDVLICNCSFTKDARYRPSDWHHRAG